jgi:hypothetical protein
MTIHAMKLLADGLLRAPEGEQGGGSDQQPTEQRDDGQRATLLFDENGDLRKDGDKAPEGQNEQKPEGGKPAGDWKEYEPDPNKSDEENAAAKLEHDKGKPQEKSEEEKRLDSVPEDGKYNPKLPEGFELNKDMLDGLSPVLAKHKITNRAFQELADVFADKSKAQTEAMYKNWNDTIEGWQDTAKKDPKIGGDKWDGTITLAHDAVNRYADVNPEGAKEFKKYMNSSGGGNHPEVIRFMRWVGEQFQEDQPPANSGSGDDRPVEPAHAMFPQDAPRR